MASRIQLRGHCQRCGAIQAATDGHVAHHGYTVKHGWFEGVCQGHGYAPLQARRDTADMVVAGVRADVADLKIKLELMEAGKIVPKEADGKRIIGGPRSGSMERVPFAEASESAQRQAVAAMIWNTKGRIKGGTDFANDFEALIERVHGTPLIEVAIPAPAERIEKGERRVAENGKILTAAYQERARVYYHWDSVKADGSPRKAQSWQGIASWRKLPIAE